MLTAESRNSSKRFSDMLKTSWTRSSINLGIIVTALGLIILFLSKFFDIGGTQLFSDVEAFVAEYGLAGIFLATILAGTLEPSGSPAPVVAATL